MGIAVAAILVIGFAVVSTITEFNRQAEETAASEAEAARLAVLPDAVRGCSISDDVVQDGGESLFLDNGGDDFGSGDLSVSDLLCVLEALDTPDAVITQMSQTRALDGTQSGTWGDFSATWTYHPDDGLDIVIRLVD